MFEKYMHQDFEQWILAEFLKNNDLFGNFQHLKKEHFLWEEHQKIYEKMEKCYAKGLPFLASKMGIQDEKEKEYFVSLSQCGGYAVNLKAIVEDLIKDSEKYNALVEANKLITLANEEPDVDVFGTLSALAVNISCSKLPTSVEQMMQELYNKMDGKEVGISTGIDDLDENMNGFQNGRLYIIGARSGMGKSAFMCSVVEKIEQKKRVGIISLEMLDKELFQRIACIRGKIPHWKIEKGKCSDNEADQYHEKLLTIKNVFINDEGSMNRGGIIATVRKMVKKQKCDIVFIDHIGLIRVEGKNNLAHEIGENTAALKSLSKELNIPIVGLCQINRSAESANEKMPTLAQLRDSGRIEEDSDCVILLFREAYYSQNQPEIENCVYKIAKCRNGKRCEVKGMFEGQYMHFT